MAEEIKLYKHFTEQLAKMGKVKRAWFTTFNLDISFFERYLLSALAGISYRELNNPTSYEALNKILANDEAEPTDENIDVKVFYDYRALMVSGKSKQTAVPLYPVDVKKISGQNPQIKFTHGVFHPKVILIETYVGEYWLMTGSANLTFGGWSRNRESFFCERITDTYIARAVGRFFTGITSSLRGFDGNDPLLNKLNSGKFGTTRSRWQFFSSFEKDTFLDQILKSDSNHKLIVWSPYFSDEIDELIQDHLSEHFETIDIVPAKNKNLKIGITEKKFMACSQIEALRFKQERLPVAVAESFVHAKAWLTPRLLAIGSWNMTRSGMNIISGNHRTSHNVEAGILYSLTAGEYKQVTDRHTLTNLKDPEFMKEEELEEEKMGLLEPFSLSVDLLLNWEDLTIELVSPTYGRLSLQAEDRIILPGFGRQPVSILENKISIRKHFKSFLTDRYVELEKKDGTTLFKGYLREQGLAERPVVRFENIDDFLKCWVDGRPEEKVELHRPTIYSEEEMGDELSEQTKKILLNDDRNPWFSSFYAFEQIVSRINQANDRSVFRTKNERISELKRIARILPGNLLELREHLELLFNSYKNEPQLFRKSPVYLWFLIEKANMVFQYFNRQTDDTVEHIKKLENLDLIKIIRHHLPAATDADKIKKWIQYMKSKLKIHA
jgi:hypothetical protein